MRRARDEWKAHRQPRMREGVHRLVFLDETGTTTKMTRLRGRACRGARLKAEAPFGHWATQTFIAGLRCDGLTAPWVIDQPMNREIFDIYVETQLAPTLQPGDVVRVHTQQRLYEYLVDRTQIVEPTAVEVMASTGSPTVTLISCYPYLVDSQRIVVFARLQN